MTFQVALLLLVAVSGGLAQTERPHCENFDCPNDLAEGGLYATGPCNAEFCDCSYGVPYLWPCPEGLVFDEENQVCNWCYNMCNKCETCTGCPF